MGERERVNCDIQNSKILIYETFDFENIYIIYDRRKRRMSVEIIENRKNKEISYIIKTNKKRDGD